METVAPPEQRTDATHMRTLLARYADVELLVRVGEYRQGTDPIADEAIAKIGRINAFLRQSSSERVSLIQTRQHMREIVR
jgi:type III secretion protein N (ATPase)